MFAGTGTSPEYAHRRLPLRLEQAQITGLDNIARRAATAKVVRGLCEPLHEWARARAPPNRSTALYVMLPALRSGKTSTFAFPATADPGAFFSQRPEAVPRQVAVHHRRRSPLPWFRARPVPQSPCPPTGVWPNLWSRMRAERPSDRHQQWSDRSRQLKAQSRQVAPNQGLEAPHSRQRPSPPHFPSLDRGGS